MKIDLGMDTINPKQRLFFESRCKFTAYGGARGGGKSWAVQKKATMMALRWPGIKILFLRRTYQELRENHIRPLQLQLSGLATYRDSDHTFTFPNGSLIIFGYCDSENDVARYQGQEYDVIFMDEATQFTEWQYSVITSSLRGANEFPKRMYLTCNPGGVGHHWVKRLFIDRQYKAGEVPEEYCFIAATVYDNSVLMKKDPGYVKLLEALPEDKRLAWLDGRWDVMEGQYFPEFDRAVHVCAPFPIPSWWNRFFAADYGLDMFAGYWGATDENGRLYIYREVYQAGKVISDAGKLIHDMSGGEAIQAYWFPPDVFGKIKASGRELPEIMAEYGVYPTKVKNDRVPGWLDLKEWLKVKDGQAQIVFFSSCTNVIESFGYLLHSKRDPNDVDTEPHQYTHGPDAIRYMVQGRPWPSVAPVEDDGEDENYREYDDQIEDFLSYGM